MFISGPISYGWSHIAMMIILMMMKTTIIAIKMRMAANIYRALTMHCFKCFACLILLLHTTLL